jgi:hypothetical protein
VRLFKNIIILLLACLMLSCGLVKTAYNNAPELTIWWLDDYFSFSQTQSLALKPALQNLHNWHRQSQLPNYISFLRDAQTSFGNAQITANEACEKLASIRTSLQAVQIEAIPILVEMAPLLSDKQLKKFQTKLIERTEKWKDDWWQTTKKEQLEARFEKTEDFAEKIYGDLSDVQLNQLKQSIEQANINPAISYKEIQRRNDDAFAILTMLQKQSLTVAEKTQLVKTGFERIQKSPNQEYQTYADKLTTHTCETIATFHASTTSKQKLHAKNWLQDYVILITDLQNKG